MKANEFIKQYGLDKAKELINGNTAMFTSYNVTTNQYFWGDVTQECEVCLKELKTAVEAWELVNIHGLEKSIEIVRDAPSYAEFYSWTLGNSGIRDKTVNLKELEAAIQVVQS